MAEMSETGNVWLARLKNIPVRTRVGFETGKQFVLGLSRDGHARMLTVLWTVCVSVLGISILSVSNPLRLLVPGLVFPLPAADNRVTIEIIGIGRTTNALTTYRRRLQPAADTQGMIQRLVHLVSEPVGLREGLSDQAGFADLEPLPRLGFALRKVWFRSAGGEMILDFRRETLEKETELFHKNRHRASNVPAEGDEDRPSVEADADAEEEAGKEGKDSEKKAKKSPAESNEEALGHYLDSYFRSLTASIFHSQKDVRSILFLLDGAPGTLNGMSFKLDRRYTRE